MTIFTSRNVPLSWCCSPLMRTSSTLLKLGRKRCSYSLKKVNTIPIRPPLLQLQTDKLTYWEQERVRNRIPLNVLLPIDLETQKRVRFTMDAMILRIDETNGWYCKRCELCGKKLEEGYAHAHCHKYGMTPAPEYSYCFKAIISEGIANATLTCFSPEADSFVKTVNDYTSRN